MEININNYEPPRIWPGLPELTYQNSILEKYPFPYLIRSGGSLYGLFWGLDKTGVSEIINILETYKILKLKLVIGVYPACVTSHKELELLLNLQNKFQDRVEFRLSVINSISEGITSSLLFVEDSSKDSILATGPNLGFKACQLTASSVSFVLRPDAVLLKEWLDWFDFIWVKHTNLLNPISTEIPDLVFEKASKEVISLWNEYKQRCCQSYECEENIEAVKVETKNETGEIVMRSKSGEEIPLPSSELKISKISPLIERISRLYLSGKLVSFNKLSRIPPLDCPAKAEWFGEKSLRVEGTITKEVKYRISALDKEDLKKFNNLKNNGNDLLRRFGFALGDGLHWMSDGMIILLQKELNRVATEALQVIYRSMGVKNNLAYSQITLLSLYSAEEENTDKIKRLVKAFIEKQLNRIISDVKRIHKELRTKNQIDQTTIDVITAELESRLEKVLNGNVIPDLIQNAISFSPNSNGDHTYNFDQPLFLLKDLAMFPRRVLSEERFYLQGIKIDPEALLDAIDVCGDHIIAASKRKNVKNQALFELSLLEEILLSEADSEVKCNAIFSVIDDKPIEEINNMIIKK